MRIVGNIPHPQMRITVFHMNDKFILKLEAGPMEQTYKFSQDEHPGFEAVQKLVDETFLSNALKRFNEMFLEMKAMKERASQ